MIVQNRTEEIIGSGHGVNIAGKVEVDVLHRDYLRVAAAGSTAFDAEYRTQRRLTQSEHSLLADLRHCLTKTHAHRSLALPSRGGVDGSHENELAVGTAGSFCIEFFCHLCLVVSIGFEVLGFNAKTCGNFSDGLHLGSLSNFDIG